MRRALSLLAIMAVSVGVPACGSDDSKSVDSEQIVRELQAKQRKREERLRRQQRLERLVEKDRAAPAPQRQTSPNLAGFDSLAKRLGGAVGAVVGPPGVGEPRQMGAFSGGVAWSTIKVPIVLRVLENADGPSGLSSAQRGLIERAITASDNGAAMELFRSLGSTTAAAAAVTEVLRQAGDDTTQVSTVGRGGFSPFGQTQWSLQAQHRFMAALAGGCFSAPASRRYVLDLMGRVTSDRWGLGSAGVTARWKGGWGPGTDGRYVARQMGVIDVGGRQLVVTLAAVAGDGQFPSAQNMATAIAMWAAQRGRSLAGAPGGC